MWRSRLPGGRSDRREATVAARHTRRRLGDFLPTLTAPTQRMKNMSARIAIDSDDSLVSEAFLDASAFDNFRAKVTVLRESLHRPIVPPRNRRRRTPAGSNAPASMSMPIYLFERRFCAACESPPDCIEM